MSTSDETDTPGTGRPRVMTWLGISPSAKPKVYQQVSAVAAANNLGYWLEIFFSAGIATFGLVESSPAVIIGAMLISPLMGPIMGTGLALAVGDLYLGINAVLNLVLSVAVSIAFSGLLVWLLPFHAVTSEILARTKPNLLDLGIALLSGLAGSVVVSRGGGKDVTALPGVAIAVALMPPLCTIGFGLGSGRNLEIMGGAGLLFVTNLFAIVASAFLVFLLVGLNTAEIRDSLQASRKDEHLTRLLSRVPMTSSAGQLHWRIGMIVILLASVSFPLARALMQVAAETVTRSTIEFELKRLVPSNALVSQQVSIGKDEIAIRVIATSRIPDAKVAAAREEIMRRTGREVQLSIDAVASKRELAELTERLARPVVQSVPIVTPKEKPIEETQKDLLNRVDAAIKEIWPSSAAPVKDFDVNVSTAGVAIEIQYTAARDLGEIPIDMVQTGLRTRLGLPDLVLKTTRVTSARSAKDRHAPSKPPARP